MAVFAISDLHLSLGVDKPMDIFGEGWANYMDKLKQNWRSTVGGDDYVIVPGDISWATYLDQALEDFGFIHELPGRKIISKGNHDYWWTTRNKLEKFVRDNGFSSVSFMHNNCFIVEDVAVCGTRGWNMPGEAGFTDEDEKIYRRELIRLELSLKEAMQGGDRRIVAALHFPPFNSEGVFSGFLDIMVKYGVKVCIYGHLHGDARKSAIEGTHHGIEFKFVAADHLGFKPLRLL